MEGEIRGTTLQAGRLAFVSELRGGGESVRVVGRVVALDFPRNRLTLGHRGATVAVDTTHLEAVPGGLNSLLMLVGEVVCQPDGQLLLVARVCRAVEGLSLELWDRSVLLHRGFVDKCSALTTQQQ